MIAGPKEVASLFQSLAPRLAEIREQSKATNSGSNAGCLLVLLPVLAVILLSVLKPTPAPAWYGWLVLAVCLAGVASAVLGWKISEPARRAQAGQFEEADRVLVQPLVDLLLPGAAFIRGGDVVPSVHPSLLLSRSWHNTQAHSRIDGRVADRPARMEVVWATGDDSIPSCLFVQVGLPFAVAGHLRVRHRSGRFLLEPLEDALIPGEFREEGFEPLEAEGARLGRDFRCDWAPLGTDETATPPTPTDGLSPRVLLTDRLIELLRTNHDVMVAMVGRSLWIILRRRLEAFERRVPAADDLRHWQEAWEAVRDVELVTREVLAAASLRG